MLALNEWWNRPIYFTSADEPDLNILFNSLSPDEQKGRLRGVVFLALNDLKKGSASVGIADLINSVACISMEKVSEARGIISVICSHYLLGSQQILDNFLERTCKEGSADFAQFLLEKGAHINGKVVGIAIDAQNVAVASVLLSNGAPCPDLMEQVLKNPKSTPAILNVLFEHGPSIDDPIGPLRKTALHIACKHNPTLALALLEMGVDPCLVDNEGNTALHEAVQQERDVKIIEALLKKERSYIDKRNNKGETPLFVAKERAGILLLENNALLRYGYNKDHPIFIAIRLEYHVLFNAYDKKFPSDTLTLKGARKQTSFMEAARYCPSIAKYLLENKRVELLIKDECGYSALHYAAMGGDLSLVIAIVEKKKELIFAITEKPWQEGGPFQMTPLHVALKAEDEIIATYLFTQGAPCLAMNSESETPFALASDLGYTDLVELMCQQSQS
jgi:ankyrin repeat protein